MADAVSCAGSLPGAKGLGLAAPVLLIAVGSLIAVMVALSKLAAGAGAPMLGYLATVWMGAGGILSLAALARRGLNGVGRLLPYSLGAGVLMAAPSAMGFLAVNHVGAGFVSLTFAFPVLVTWIIARTLGMSGAVAAQVGGVLAGLAGGVLLAFGKLAATGGPDGGAFWVLVASSIPVVLAIGNIYRTRYWPEGERALPLAALSVLLGAAAVLPLAALGEAEALPRLWRDPEILLLCFGGIGVVAAQFTLQFRLQELAGPVYMSQIGTVAAMAGAVIAVTVLGEALPPFFWLAASLIAVGTAMFHFAALGIAAETS